ncbi:MAG: rhomboid family intramembrane serine protease [bacterium]
MSEENKLGAILCPDCKKLISANAEVCPYCGLKNPNLWGLGIVLKKLFGGHVSLVPVIAVVCIGMFVLSLLLAPKAIFQSRGFFLFGFLSPDFNVLIKLGMTGKAAMSRDYWWTLITAIYLHGGLMHILFNVLWIRQLGPVVEDLYGISRSFLIFTLSGVFGYVVSSYFNIYFTIGASGSIFGLLGALVYYGRKRGGTFGKAIYQQTGQWALVLFIIGFIMPGGIVNNFAHGGGFVGGYLSAVLFGFSEMKKENRTHQLLAIAAMTLTVAAFLLTLINKPYHQFIN